MSKYSNQMLFSIVIPTWRRSSALREAISALVDQTLTAFEVVVVVDGEDSDTRALADNLSYPFPVRWVFHSQNQGQAAARNTGAEAASGEFVLFLDDDTLADPNLLSRHFVSHQDASPDKRMFVCGRIVEDRQSPLTLWTDKFLQRTWEGMLEQPHRLLSECEGGSVNDDVEKWVYFGLNCSIRRDLFLASGGFRRELRSCEDMEFGHRLYRSGVQIVGSPLAIVRHCNVKLMTDYFRYSWQTGGQADAERVLKFGQRNPQTWQFSAMNNGPFLKKFGARAAWRHAPAFRRVASLLERSVNATGSQALFQAWIRVACRAEYWSGVRAAGCTSEMLYQIPVKPRCALAFGGSSNLAYVPKMVERLIHKHYRSVDIGEWMESQSLRSLLLTFDDPSEELYRVILPLIIQLHLKPVLFLAADQLCTKEGRGNGDRLGSPSITIEQIRELRAYGVEFGSHGMSRRWLPALSESDLQREVSDSKSALEDVLGTPVKTFLYPQGGVDQRVRAAVGEAGYELAFCDRPGLNWWNDPLCQRRVRVDECDTSIDLALKLRTGRGLWSGNLRRNGEQS